MFQSWPMVDKFGVKVNGLRELSKGEVRGMSFLID